MGETYETNDLPLIAFLLCKGMEIENKRKIGNIFFFTFKNNLRLELALSEYTQGKPLVCPVSFYTNLKKVKRIIWKGDQNVKAS